MFMCSACIYVQNKDVKMYYSFRQNTIVTTVIVNTVKS